MQSASTASAPPPAAPARRTPVRTGGARECDPRESAHGMLYASGSYIDALTGTNLLHRRSVQVGAHRGGGVLDGTSHIFLV